MDHSNILKLVRTTEEQNHLISLIEVLLENNFKERALANDEFGNSNFMKNASDTIISEQTKLNIVENKKEKEKFLNSLLDLVRNLNTLKISIAVRPNEELVKALDKWTGQNLSGKVIFDLNFDPDILGGAIIINKKGDYANYSLLKKIDAFFLNHKQDILSLL